MDPEFNEAEIIRCNFHPKRPISLIYCKQNCIYPSRLACSQCVLKYQSLEGFAQVRDVLYDPRVILRARDWERKEYGIYHSIGDYFDLLEKDPDEIMKQIEKLQRDLKEGIEKYKQFRIEIAKYQQQFNEDFGQIKVMQAFKDILKVDDYHYDPEKSKLEEIIQNYVLQFKDQNNQKFKQANEALKKMDDTLEQNKSVQQKVLSDFFNDFNQRTFKDVDLLCQQLLNQGIFMKQSNICDSFYFFQLIQRIQNQKNILPKITLLFKGSEHGMNAQAFWGKCSNQGPTIVICKSKNGYVFGGYSPCKWIPNGAYQKDDSKTSFLFSYTRKEIYPIVIVDNAIYGNNAYGPTFGANHNLYIHANFQSGSSLMNNNYYSNQQYKIENQSTHLMGDSTPQLVEMEVFLIEL